MPHGILARLCAFVLMLSVSAAAVSGQSEKVNLPAGTITINEAFKAVQEQTGYKFAINHSRFSVDKSVKLTKPSSDLDTIMRQILPGTGHTYVIESGHIMIIPGEIKPLEVPVPVEVPKQIDRTESAPLLANTGIGISEMKDAPKMISTITSPKSYSFPIQTVGGSRMPVKDDGSKVALKTNLLYAAGTLTPNLALEVGVGRRSTLNFSGSYNPWNREGSQDDNKKLVHWMGNIEYRYWLCERFNGHFFGVHAFGGKYNVNQHDVPLMFEKEYRYDGWAIGGGVSYGYHLMLGKSWGLEFNIGAGAAYTKYEKFECDWCGFSEGKDSKVYFGPTRAGITLVFIIK